MSLNESNANVSEDEADNWNTEWEETDAENADELPDLVTDYEED